ncbi:MAG TPA: hypothetical protein VK657_09800 [Terriglobales bacterium]|nr:hypothetical protein [Terriglobales bacterium]
MRVLLFKQLLAQCHLGLKQFSAPYNLLLKQLSAPRYLCKYTRKPNGDYRKTDEEGSENLRHCASRPSNGADAADELQCRKDVEHYDHCSLRVWSAPERSLAIRKRAFGAEYPDTAMSRQDIYNDLQDCGDLAPCAGDCGMALARS